jgi:hypothetical protein
MSTDQCDNVTKCDKIFIRQHKETYINQNSALYTKRNVHVKKTKLFIMICK